MRVPTNEELEANGPDNVREAVAGWLVRHARPLDGGGWTADKMLWAANNLVIDPTIKKFIRE